MASSIIIKNQKRYYLQFKYDGYFFYGYSKQLNKRTVQNEIEEKLSIFFNQKINIYSASRTDRYVHALKQIAHFDVNKEFDLKKLQFFLNSTLDFIEIDKIIKIDSNFHSRYNVKEKTYHYFINCNQFNLFEQNHVYQLNTKINLKQLQKLAKQLIGEHNFASFTAKQNYQSYIRNIKKIKITKNKGIIKIEITGSGFLRFMIRNIVGAMIAICLEKEQENYLEKLLLNPKRGNCFYKAPGCGLYLVDIKY